MLSHRQKGLARAFTFLGRFVFLVQPGSCLPPPNVLLGGARNHLACLPLPTQPPWMRQLHLQLSCVRRNCFHAPLVLDQNTKSKCASISIANVQGNGVEIICSLKKKSEEILFLTSWVLHNIIPPTLSCRSCSGRAFRCRSQSVCQVLGIYEPSSGCGSVRTRPCRQPRCAQQHGGRSPEGR